MKRWLVVFITVVGLLAAPVAEGKRVRLHAGDPAPELGLADTAGQPLAFGDHGTVILFVHAGQARSDQLLATLPAIQEKLAKEGAALVVVASGKGPLPSLPTGVTGRLAHDTDGEAFHRYGVVVSPSTTVVDGQGRIAAAIPSLPQDYAQRIGAALDLVAGREPDAALLTTGPTPAEKEGRQFLEQARRLQQEGQVHDALTVARQAISLTPEDLDARLTLAELLLANGDGGGGRKLFEEVLTSHPRQPRALTGLGRALAATGASERAVEVLREAIRVNPNPVHAHYALGRLYEQQGKAAEAVAEYQHALTKLAEGRR